MVLQAFIDDSGSKGQDKYFVFAGILGIADEWGIFSDAWRACLQEAPAVRGPFKMRDAARLQSQFFGWPKEQRDEKLRALARIVNEHNRVCVQCTFDLGAHKESWAKLNKPMNEPYFWAYHVMIMALGFEVYDLGFTDKRFEIIFDDNVIHGLRAKRWYPMIREVIRAREPDLFPILPVDPVFRDDEDCVPLQAADMFAWCTRRNTTHPDEPKFDWLLDEMPNVKGSHHSQFYDADRMFDVLRLTQQVEKDDLPTAALEAYRKLYDDND